MTEEEQVWFEKDGGGAKIDRGVIGCAATKGSLH